MQFEISERYYRILYDSLNQFIPKNVIQQDSIKNLQSKLDDQHDNTNENLVAIEVSECEYRFLLSCLNNNIRMVKCRENSMLELRNFLKFRHDFPVLF